jgi:hypothetical protein
MSGLKDVKRRWGDAFAQTHWAEMERLLADHYRAQGYRVEHCGTGGSGGRFDGGIDLKLFRNDDYIVVQCKHWNAKQVPHNEVHELIGVRLTQRATGAILVTSGEFTYAALKAAAKDEHIELIDGEALRRMLGPLMPVTTRSPVLEPHRWQPVTDIALEFASDALGIRAPRRRRRGVSEMLGVLVLVKVIAPILLFLGFIWFARGVIDDMSTRTSARRAVPASTQSASAHAAPTAYVGPGSPRGAPSHYPDAAESKRRADEAIKVLEATTPELEYMPGTVPASVEQ